jgi:alkylation response protein AidB-like acyl-CoA dehydrogenase
MLIDAALAAELERLIETRVNPGTAARDAAGTPLPRQLFADAGALGLLAAERAVTPVLWGELLERIGHLSDDAGFPLLLSTFAAVAGALGDRDARLLRGERLGAWAYSEGADPFAFRSRARAAGGGFVLDGEKHLVTGGALADLFLVYLRGDRDDLELYLVEREDPGVSVTPVATCGLRSAGLATLRLDGVRVAGERRLVAADGLSHAQAYLNRHRLFVVCPVVGRMAALLERCVGALRATERYGQPLTDYANVCAALGRMAVAVDASRAVVARALAGRASETAQAAWDGEGAAAKYFVTEQALATAHGALRLLGSSGFVQEQGFDRALRDFLALVAGAGTQDLLEVHLGTQLVADWERRQRRAGSETERGHAA